MAYLAFDCLLDSGPGPDFERFASLKASKSRRPICSMKRFRSPPSTCPVPKPPSNWPKAQYWVRFWPLVCAPARHISSEEELRSAMEGAGRAAHKLEKYLSALATIASAAPLLGLLGTVIGMIEIFGSQPGASSGAGNPAQLAHGISIALYNTAFGLMVAIPSLIFWRYFRARVDGYLLGMELASEQFVRHLGRIKPAK
jgi:biopolymer transport protein ExbB